MVLWCIRREDKLDYPHDTFDGFIINADSEPEARSYADANGWGDVTPAAHEISATIIGTAALGLPKGIVFDSFRPG